MSPAYHGGDPGVPPHWEEHRSSHFVLRFVPGTQIEKNATTLVSRLEAVRSAAVEALDLQDLPREPVRVYLSDVPLDELSESLPGDGRPQEPGAGLSLALYAPGTPGEELEITFLELLLSSSLGVRTDRSAMLVDGLLGHVEQRTGDSDPAKLNATLGRLQDEGQGISLAGFLRGPTRRTRSLYRQVVTSFISFLLAAYGPEAFKRFAQEFTPDLADQAAEAAYGEPMAALEREWLAALLRPPVPERSGAVPGGTGTPVGVGGPVPEGSGQQPPPEPPDATQSPAPPGIASFLRGALVYLRPYWAQQILILLAAVIGAVFVVILPIAFGQIITALTSGDYDDLWPVLYGVVALFLLYVPATLGESYLVARVGARVMNDIQYKMFAHLQRLSTDYYFRTRPGEITSRFTNDLALLNTALTQVLPMLAALAISFILSLISLFFLQGVLALVIVLALPLFLILPARLGRKAAEVTQEVQQDRAQVASTIQENVGAQQVVKAYGMQRRTLGEFREQLDRLGRSAARGGFLGSLPGTTANVSVILIQLLALVGGTIAVIYGAMGVGALASFQLLLGNVTGPMMAITGIWQMLLQSAVGMQRVEDLLEEEPKIADAPDAQPLSLFRNEIRFNDVSFSYTGEQLNLRDVNLAVSAGQSVAFVGPSGSGKSTILNLIIRFYDPTSGAVTIDGEDLRDVTQESLRAQIGTVFQDTFLYNANVRENIRMVRPGATDEEVEAAARDAEIHDFIITLPQGYDTEVGERGANLSGGQRQRISIARAILYNPEILVLDEPTSALDPQTEAAINATLREQGRGRTVLTVTHRLASVVNVDRVFVLERGSIVEQGTHEELLRGRGLYYRLWGQQNGFEDAERIGAEASRLRAIPFFEDMDETMLSVLDEHFSREHRFEGQTVFEEGDPGDRLYFVDRGEVEVLIPGPAGEDRRVALLRDGDYFGEIALLEDVPRTATVRTRAPTSLLSLDREQFLGLLRSAPGLRAAFERGVEERRRANLAAAQDAAGTGGR